MTGILLTQYDGSILGPIAKLLGIIMNGIFNFLDFIHIPNIGLSIILFTIVIYLLLMPLTIKQQKFSKLSAKMNPELQAIQNKYKNKKDNESVAKMNEEMQAVYKKYGVSPTGSCVQLLIQMPILFALYRVIDSMPAYVTKIKESLEPLANAIISASGGSEFMQTLESARYFAKRDFTLSNTIVDVLNKASTAEWNMIGEKFPDIANVVDTSRISFEKYNNFLGLNIANSPSYILKEAWADKAWLLIIGALLVPVLAALTQWLNTLFMPQPENNNASDNPMASSMKTMNVMMPLMSAVFCFTLPAGMGLYWIAGAVVRSIQQIVINKHIDKMDIDKLVENNLKKENEKRAKRGLAPQTLSSNANISTKNVTNTNSTKSGKSQQEKDAAMKKATEYYNKNAKPGSIAAKANMVKQYNEKNNK